MNPAPPVTRTFLITRFPLWTIQFEQVARRVDDLRVLHRCGRFAQLPGGLVPQLREDLPRERFDDFAVFLAEVLQRTQRALHFLGADLLRPVAQLANERHYLESAVPVPELVQAFADDRFSKRHFQTALLERAFDD